MIQVIKLLHRSFSYSLITLSLRHVLFNLQISNTNTKVAVQYQQSPPPRLNGVLQNLHWRFRQKVWEFFCPNFNGRPPTGTTSQSQSLDSEDEDEEENNISQAQDEANPKGRKMMRRRKTMNDYTRTCVCVFLKLCISAYCECKYVFDHVFFKHEKIIVKLWLVLYSPLGKG